MRGSIRAGQLRNRKCHNFATSGALRQMIQNWKTVVVCKRLLHKSGQQVCIRMRFRHSLRARQPANHDFGYVCHLVPFPASLQASARFFSRSRLLFGERPMRTFLRQTIANAHTKVPYVHLQRFLRLTTAHATSPEIR